MIKALFSMQMNLSKSMIIILIFLTCIGPSSAQSIVFKHENSSDLRGLLNVFNAFQRSCLNQPVTHDLPAKLLPVGHQIVSREMHIEFDEHARSNRAAIISKTGFEQSDWDEGHLYVDFLMPTDRSPYGECTVFWKREWDYKEDAQKRVALGMHGAIDAQISFYLQAVLTTRPADTFIANGVFAGSSDWDAKCWNGKICRFRIIYSLVPQRGIDLSIARISVWE